jgi:hypothetical protein
MQFHEAVREWIEWADREGLPALGPEPMTYASFLARLAAHRRQRDEIRGAIPRWLVSCVLNTRSGTRA